jgi:predicted MFS family arabinose efflux permease
LIAVWSVATLLSGMAVSYPWLLTSRAILGAVTATAGPTVASLIGDFFPAADRGRIYGMILAGDLVGTGIGFLISGDIASALSWRYAFWWLVLPGLLLAWLAWRLAEPERGGQSGSPRRPALAARAVERSGVEPDAGLVLHSDPTDRSIWWAIGYVLRVRTNLVIIVASALGYFFFAGLRSFAIINAMSHYGLSKPTADAMVLVIGLGALAGVFAGGRMSDRLLRRGHVRARILVPLVSLLALPPVLALAIATTSMAIAVPLLILGAFLLGAPNPPMDAARLDIMHPRLWGRAEGVRTVLRMAGEAGAPVLLGFVSQYLFGGPGAAAGAAGGGTGGGQVAGAGGLEYALLLSLLPLLAAGLLIFPALRTYPRDVATVSASIRAMTHGRATRRRPRGGQVAAARHYRPTTGGRP